MEHKANFYATGYLGHFLTIAIVLFGAFFIYGGDVAALAILIGVFALVLFRLRSRKMSFEDDVFRYDGWFMSVTIPLSDIVKVESSGRLGYPHDRTHGPAEYRITTKTRKVWVSLLFFDYMASREFHERLVKKGKS